jgi:hypothetical protein
MTRERPVRFCEGGEVRSLSATRRLTNDKCVVGRALSTEMIAKRPGFTSMRPGATLGFSLDW